MRWNPAAFIMQYDAPFNFDYGVKEWDALYHDNKGFPELAPQTDPCTWSEDLKNLVEDQRDEWVALYERWCRGDDDKYEATNGAKV